MNSIADISSKSLRDKIYTIFEGKFPKISMFNMICHLYTLYLYNNMEDPIPEIAYIRQGRNLKFYGNTMGCFIQNAFLNYDFVKNSIKINDKKYINVQEFFDNILKQFNEQKSIESLVNTVENYNHINNLDNIPNCNMYEVTNIDENKLEAQLFPEYMLGKKLMENTKGGMLFNNGDKNTRLFMRLVFDNVYSPKGIINHLAGNADNYKPETLKKISHLFYTVADALSDAFLKEDKLIEIKMLD